MKKPPPPRFGDLTHRRGTKVPPKTTGYAVLFSKRDNEHYGDHIWVLKTKLPSIPKEVIKFCKDFYQISISEAEDLLDPEEIVEHAGAWDDPDFVTALWEAMEQGDLKYSPGYRTWDGAVVIDPFSVKLKYYHANNYDLK